MWVYKYIFEPQAFVFFSKSLSLITQIYCISDLLDLKS